MEQDQFFNLVRLVEVKDACTAAHTWRVALYARALAAAMNVDEEHLPRIMRAAALHDIGKIELPTEILHKPGRLTDEEFDVIREHPMRGYDRLKRMGEADPLVLSLVRSHHERMDGKGYPDGLPGERIPIAARLFAVVDSFDAMTSIRPYRRGTASEAISHAIDELRAKAGSAYCAEVVERFTELVASGRLRWIHAHFNDGANYARWREPENVEEIEQIATRLCPRVAIKGG